MGKSQANISKNGQPKKAAEKHGRKPGPHEHLHSLSPFTFQQALGAILKAKPAKVEKVTKKPAKKKKTR